VYAFGAGDRALIIGYSLWDSGFIHALGYQAIWVHIGLQRLIWTESKAGNSKIRQLSTDGFACTTASIKNISDGTTLSYRQVQRQLSILERIGWVDIIRRGNGSTHIYKLGLIVDGNIHLYSDADLIAYLFALKQEEHKISNDNTKVLSKWGRTEFAKEWFKPTEARKALIHQMHSGVYTKLELGDLRQYLRYMDEDVLMKGNHSESELDDFDLWDALHQPSLETAFQF